MPDPKAEFHLLDRVICVKKLRRAPLGEFGTVIGLLNTESGKKIDVLFDKPYFGGQIMRFVFYLFFLLKNVRYRKKCLSIS